jgi:uncharacterized protein (TIGR04141 family)
VYVCSVLNSFSARAPNACARASSAWKVGALRYASSNGPGCDQGYRLIPDHLKDKRFGLSFAVRQMDPNLIRGAVSGSLGQARTDISLVPGGAPVPLLGIRDHSRIVRSLGGYLDELPLTRSRYTRGRAVSAQGGCGLRIALGIEPEALISDLRAIARICREDIPHQDLEFVDHIAPVEDTTTLDVLNQGLDDLLGRPADGRISVSVPSEHHAAYAEATTYVTRINSSGALRSDDFEPDYVLTRARLTPPGERLRALREGTVTLARDRRAGVADTLAVTSALTWLEAAVSVGSGRFFLMEGEWYEAGSGYVDECRAAVATLFSPSPSVSLPAWIDGESENAYNNRVADEERPDWLCLDTKNVTNPLRPRDQVEICDLLMPDGTLVLVKRAGGSGPLSHLFNQAKVAVELLQESARVRAEFTEKVARLSRGELVLPDDFTPKRIVLAMLLKNRENLTPDSVFGFSQITIAQTAKALAARGVTVEVVGIPGSGANALPLSA